MFFYKLGIMQFVLNFFMAIKSIITWVEDFFFCLINLLQPFFAKNVYFLSDTKNPHAELIDAFSLFEYMFKKGHNCFYIINKSHPQFEQIKKNYPKNIIALDKNTTLQNWHIKHFFKFLRLKTYFSAWGEEFNNVSLHNFLYNNKFIEYIFVDHGIILLKSFIFDLYDKNKFNKILISNDFEKEIVKKHMGYEENQLIKACLPRLDLIKEKVCEKNIFIYFTWRLSFDKTDYRTSKYYQKLCSLFNNQRLKTLLEKNNITLNIGLHHKILEKHSDFNFSGKINIVQSTKISEYIRKSDLLITDYSSVWTDFLFQNKPVIFYRLDFDDENLITQDKGDFEFASLHNEKLFNISLDEEKTIDLIEKYIKNNFELEAENTEKAEKLFYIKKDICAKILKEMHIE